MRVIPGGGKVEGGDERRLPGLRPPRVCPCGREFRPRGAQHRSLCQRCAGFAASKETAAGIEALLERARRPGFSSEVVVRRKDPATLRPQSAGALVCAACGLAIGSEHGYRQGPGGPEHVGDGCERAMARKVNTGIGARIVEELRSAPLTNRDLAARLGMTGKQATNNLGYLARTGRVRKTAEKAGGQALWVASDEREPLAEPQRPSAQPEAEPRPSPAPNGAGRSGPEDASEGLCPTCGLTPLEAAAGNGHCGRNWEVGEGERCLAAELLPGDERARGVPSPYPDATGPDEDGIVDAEVLGAVETGSSSATSMVRFDPDAAAERFLSELAERAGGGAVVDLSWGVALGRMLAEGWRIAPPA